VAQLRARYRTAQGDAPGALRLLHDVADERRTLSPESFVTAPLVVDEALAWLACGDPDEALSTLRRLPDGPDRRIGLARVRLATGQPGEALAELGDAADDPSLPPALAIRAQLAAAAALDATGHPGEVLRRLEGALAAARTEGFRRPFVEVSPWWRQALEPHAHLLREHGWLTGRPSARVARPAPDTEPPALVVEPLTARELEVLRLAAQPMSSREVAETLHLSVNTVKTHLRSIYRKLAAPTRNKAVRRARALGIL
jgi:LuxR family maltose regulon positive regulatory protein